MKHEQYPSDVAELAALAQKEEQSPVPAPLTRQEAEHLSRGLARMTLLFLKIVLLVDRGRAALPTDFRPVSVIVTYAARAITILLPLAALLVIAALPLLFLDLWAAGALLLLALALVGVIALLIALCFVLYGRAAGPGARRGRFPLDLTGALGHLAGGPR